MKRQSLLFVFLIGILFYLGCSPKVQDTTTPTVEQPPIEEIIKELDPNGCIKFNDLSAAESDKISDYFNIYRDRIKEKNYIKAYPTWKKVYQKAPSTNGRIDYVFRDGLKIYDAFIEGTTDTILQQKYVDTMMMIYEKAVICFPEMKSYYLSKQGFDLYYNYKGRATDEEIYQMLKTAVEADGNDSRVSTIIPLSSLNYNLYSEDKISRDDATKTLNNVNNVVKHNSENCDNEKECNAWTQVEQYTVYLADRFENTKGFFDCDFFMDKYYAEFQDNSENCDFIEDLYRKLNRAGCPKENEKMVALIDAFKGKCMKSSTDPDLACGRENLENDRFNESIECYQRYADKTDNIDAKATILLRIAKIHYAHTRRFAKAREAAREALKIKPNWGEPYLLIGKLYASSGPICGPGTGWDSQIVTWPAIDKWEEAKRRDPSVAKEANKLIQQYSKYMPSNADVFVRPTINVGDSFKVNCWIQETTKVRIAP